MGSVSLPSFLLLPLSLSALYLHSLLYTFIYLIYMSSMYSSNARRQRRPRDRNDAKNVTPALGYQG